MKVFSLFIAVWHMAQGFTTPEPRIQAKYYLHQAEQLRKEIQRDIVQLEQFKQNERNLFFDIFSKGKAELNLSDFEQGLLEREYIQLHEISKAGTIFNDLLSPGKSTLIRDSFLSKVELRSRVRNTPITLHTQEQSPPVNETALVVPFLDKIAGAGVYILPLGNSIHLFDPTAGIMLLFVLMALGNYNSASEHVRKSAKQSIILNFFQSIGTLPTFLIAMFIHQNMAIAYLNIIHVLTLALSLYSILDSYVDGKKSIIPGVSDLSDRL